MFRIRADAHVPGKPWPELYVVAASAIIDIIHGRSHGIDHYP